MVASREETSGTGAGRAGGPLDGHDVVFTGRLATMNRGEAGQLVRRLGGTCSSSPSERTRYVVVGEAGVPLNRQGKPDARVEKALAYRDAGRQLDVLSEAEFLELLDLQDTDNVRKYYTVLELHRLLHVSPTSIRAWVRSGLIAAAAEQHGLSLFDFAQVAEARALTRLLQDGVPLSRIKKSLQRLRNHLPHIERSLSQWTLVEKNREVLIRLDDGRLSNSRGQLYFEFFDQESVSEADRAGGTDEDDRILVARPPIRSAEQCLADGLEHEAEGEFGEAENAYREAIEHEGPNAVLCFNLGNIYYQQGRMHQALERYSLAVELDPDYAEAWNNLGNVLSDLGQNDKAVFAYERSLRAAPHYADAHYNIAESYLELGRRAEAHRHWSRYLTYDASSAWAKTARMRLTELEPLES